MPENTVYVGRGSKYGNPFVFAAYRKFYPDATDDECVRAIYWAFKIWLSPSWKNIWDNDQSKHKRKAVLDGIGSLRGKNLACWCPLTDKDGNPVPCHADVLLDLANKGSP